MSNCSVKSLRIAIYFPFLYPWVLDLTRELSDEVGEVKFYTTGILGNYPWKEQEKSTCLVPRLKLLGEIVPHPELLCSFSRYRPHLLLLFATESIASLFLWMLCKPLRIRVIPIVEENSERKHNNPLLTFLAEVKMWLAKRLHRGAKLIIAESQASKNYLIRIGCSDERIKVIPHGTNIHYFQPKVRNEELAQRINLSEEDLKKVIVLFVGEFREFKGAEYMKQVIMSLAGHMDILFLIPGFGQIFTRDREFLEKSANVRIYPPLHFNEMPDLYCLSNIVVVPSKYYETASSDQSPNSLIEAMACGRSVIGSNTGGIPTIMGNAGVLVPANDPEAIVHAVLRLASNKELMEKLGNNARERAVTVLSNRAYAYSILELYAATMNEGR
jgi:glycosyltransferase involved in cell wall biosynthesis